MLIFQIVYSQTNKFRNAIANISDYDTGTYYLGSSKYFVSGFYELNFKLNVDSMSLSIEVDSKIEKKRS
jgi:hypothetical protein